MGPHQRVDEFVPVDRLRVRVTCAAHIPRSRAISAELVDPPGQVRRVGTGDKSRDAVLHEFGRSARIDERHHRLAALHRFDGNEPVVLHPRHETYGQRVRQQLRHGIVVDEAEKPNAFVVTGEFAQSRFVRPRAGDQQRHVGVHLAHRKDDLVDPLDRIEPARCEKILVARTEVVVAVRRRIINGKVGGKRRQLSVPDERG